MSSDIPNLEQSSSVVQDRLIVLETIYHQPTEQEPSCYDSKYIIKLETKEQVYYRRTSISNHWVLVEKGWVKKSSCILLKNADKTNVLEINLDPRDREEVEDPQDRSAILELNPQESFRLRLSDDVKIYVRTKRINGLLPTSQTSYEVFVFPE